METGMPKARSRAAVAPIREPEPMVSCAASQYIDEWTEDDLMKVAPCAEASTETAPCAQPGDDIDFCYNTFFQP